MILHLLRMRRNVNRTVFNDRENVSSTLSVRKPVQPPRPVRSRALGMSYGREGDMAEEIGFSGEHCAPCSSDGPTRVSPRFQVVVRKFKRLDSSIDGLFIIRGIVTSESQSRNAADE